MNETKTKKFVEATTLLRFLIKEDNALDSLFIYSSDAEFYTTDRDLYEAVACIMPYDNVNIKKLGKFLERVQVVSAQNKPLLNHGRMEELRKIALR